MSTTKYLTIMLVAYVTSENDAAESFGIDYNYYGLDKHSYKPVAGERTSEKQTASRPKFELTQDEWKPITIVGVHAKSAQHRTRVNGEQGRENLYDKSNSAFTRQRTSSAASNGANRTILFDSENVILKLAGAPSLRSSGTLHVTSENGAQRRYTTSSSDDADERVRNLVANIRGTNSADGGQWTGNESNERRQPDHAGRIPKKMRHKNRSSFDDTDIAKEEYKWVRKPEFGDHVHDVSVNTDERNLVAPHILNVLKPNESHQRYSIIGHGNGSNIARKVDNSEGRASGDPNTIGKVEENALEYDDVDGEYADAHHDSNYYDKDSHFSTKTLEVNSQEQDTAVNRRPNTNEYDSIWTRDAFVGRKDDTFTPFHYAKRNENTSLFSARKPKPYQNNGKFAEKRMDLYHSPNALGAEEKNSVDEIEPQTNFTAEYHGQLLDSFGGANSRREGTETGSYKRYLQNKNDKLQTHDDTKPGAPPSQIVILAMTSQPQRRNLFSSPPSTLSHLPPASAGEIYSSEEDSAKRKNSFFTSHRAENLNNSRRQNDEDDDDDGDGDLQFRRRMNEYPDFASFLNLTAAQLKEFIPKTLRANFLFVKKLLAEYWSYSCEEKATAPSSPFYCFKKITLRMLDKAIDADSVGLTDAVSLVKDETLHDTNRSFSAGDVDEESDWQSNLLEKVRKLFYTHSLKVRLINPKEDNFQIEGRRRHRFRRVFPVVTSIYMIFTAVLIPLVFQFMAMMGGKSFVVGKIALLFALYNSFNKFIGGYGDTRPLPIPYHYHHHYAPQLAYSPPTYYHENQFGKRKSDKIFHYAYTTVRSPINYTYFTQE